MWWAVWLLVTVRVDNQAYQYDDTEQFRDDYDFYDEEEVPSSTSKYIFTVDAPTRVRRYGMMDHATRDGYDVRDVKDALRQVFSGRRMENSYTLHTGSWKNYNEDNIMSVVVTRSKKYFYEAVTALSSLENNGKIRARPDQSWNINSARRGWFPLPGPRSDRRQGDETTSASLSEVTTKMPTRTQKSTSTTTSPTTSTTTSITASSTTSTTASTTTSTTASSTTSTTTSPTMSTTTSPTRTTSALSKAATTVSPTRTVKPASSNTTSTATLTTTIKSSSSNITTTASANANTTETDASTTELYSINTTFTPITLRTTKSTTPRFDIEALLDIVANLTYDYDTNLTQVLNETLQKYSIPTCGTPTTTVTTTTVTTTEVFYNTTVISKCFVCGLDIAGIPRNTFCSDAFATDFLPLVPIDPTAKGHIASFRKYCRYFDVNNYQVNKTDPRAMLGRWTGGCSVRWIDLSGVYTQRSCRNRLRPTTGLHFASKRMAKLELALSNVDNGCIISPMATLVPLSRGISLFARFHACVCTGNWCNRGILAPRWTTNVFYFMFLLFRVIDWYI